MIEIGFKPSFIRQSKHLEKTLRDEVEEKILLFKDGKNNSLLKIHRLHGLLSGVLSFSVNYKIRIVFEYESKNKVVLLAIGSHDIYK